MDTHTAALADAVRAKRIAIDNDLELLRVRLQRANPLKTAELARWGKTVAPIIATTGAVWLWMRRRRSVGSLRQLLVHELRDLYAMEQRLVPELDRMSALATNPDLKQAFAMHRRETEAQVERLERTFRSIGARPKRGTAAAVAGVLREAERLLKRKVRSDVRDAWLIASGQQIEHIEMAGYGTARTFAETLGHRHAAQLLQQTLDEERTADMTLSNLAERFVNLRSAQTLV